MLSERREAQAGLDLGSSEGVDAGKLDGSRAIKSRHGVQLDLEDAIAAAPPRTRRKERGSARALTVVATIEKSRCSQLRVALSQWRGEVKLELCEATSQIPGVYMSTPNGVTLDITKLGELIDALRAVEIEARKRGRCNNASI